MVIEVNEKTLALQPEPIEGINSFLSSQSFGVDSFIKISKQYRFFVYIFALMNVGNKNVRENGLILRTQQHFTIVDYKHDSLNFYDDCTTLHIFNIEWITQRITSECEHVFNIKAKALPGIIQIKGII